MAVQISFHPPCSRLTCEAQANLCLFRLELSPAYLSMTQAGDFDRGGLLLFILEITGIGNVRKDECFPSPRLQQPEGVNFVTTAVQ